MNTKRKLESKILSLSNLLPQIEAWRNDGQKIVFTNGCFDILHAGHIHILTSAADAGDKLILGLNTDLSVKRLKGEGRPVNNQSDRALILAALAFIDVVILFEEETPINLIKKINPDVLVKGGDYAEEQVVGADFVKSNGGKVMLIDLVPGVSTTQTIQKLKP